MPTGKPCLILQANLIQSCSDFKFQSPLTNQLTQQRTKQCNYFAGYVALKAVPRLWSSFVSSSMLNGWPVSASELKLASFKGSTAGHADELIQRIPHQIHDAAFHTHTHTFEKIVGCERPTRACKKPQTQRNKQIHATQFIVYKTKAITLTKTTFGAPVGRQRR